jgi:DNA-binding NarL/FixJ family response regulator
MKTRVLLADDHQIIRDGLRALLEKESEFTVVGEAENGREAVRLARELEPDVIVMDIAMPDLNGIEATHQIREEFPNARIVALSMHMERKFVTRMLEAGASGYVLKAGAFEEVSAAIRKVMTDRVYTSPKVTDIVMEDYVRQLSRPKQEERSPLTPREREVLQLLAEGNSSKEISSSLNISINTVDTHRHRIMEKLNLRSVAELTKYAIREGLTSIDS